MLNIPDLDCVIASENHDSYIIDAKSSWHDARPICETCHSANTIRFGTRKRKFQDLPMHGKKVTINYHLRRFKCLSCGSVITEDVHIDMDTKRTATKRLVEYVAKQSATRTFTSLAAEIGVDEKTIRNIVTDFNETRSELQVVATPRVLGIDEVHLVRKMRCVFVDIEAAKLYDMIETRSQKAVTTYLMNMPNRKDVEIICIDMHYPYRRAAHAAIKDATVIIDKFHVVKYANSCLDMVRKRLKDETVKARKALKRERFVLLKRNHSLKPFEHMNLDIWSKKYPLLGQAYKAKEEFFHIYDAADRQEAEDRFDQWIVDLPSELEEPFKPLLSATSNWYDEIFNYFDYRYTNATTEAINGIIKIANRTGRGYSFNSLRHKVLAASYPSETTSNDPFDTGSFLL